MPVLVLSTIPCDSTRMIVASLYNLPLTVLKSSASASVADRSAKIASVVAYSFTLSAFCLFCSPHGNDKMMHELSQMTFSKLARFAGWFNCAAMLAMAALWLYVGFIC